MCLIIHKEEKTILSKEFLEDVRSQNPHGWGILYHDRRGKAKVKKGLKMEEFWALYKNFEKHNAEAVIHFRFATHGKKNTANAHPYKVLGGEKPIYLMHNGTIAIDGAEKEGKLSDTRIFIRDVLQPMLEHIKNPHEFIRSNHFEFLMESVAGDNSSRFVLFDDDGYMFYGGWYKTTTGVWVSNTYAYDVDNAHRNTYYNNYNNYSSRDDDAAKKAAEARGNGSGVIPFVPSTVNPKDDDSVDLSRLANRSGYYDAADLYGDNDHIDDEEEAWVQSIQDVTDNFEFIADTYWSLNDEEIEYASQKFYEGVWFFVLNETTPQYSVIHDVGGGEVSPEDVMFANAWAKSDVTPKPKEKVTN